MRTDKTEIAGVCPACEKEVEGRRGLKKEAVLRHHMFQICIDYPWSIKKNKLLSFLVRLEI